MAYHDGVRRAIHCDVAVVLRLITHAVNLKDRVGNFSSHLCHSVANIPCSKSERDSWELGNLFFIIFMPLLSVANPR